MEKRILTGWKRQKEDSRDYKYKLDPTIELPPSASVEKYLPAPRDQKSIGACVSFAVTGAIECLEKKNKDKFVGLSELFVYWGGRVIEGTELIDDGLDIRDGIKSVIRNGVCPRSMWPYKASLLYKKPSQKCFDNGSDHQITAYYSVNTMRGLREAIYNGNPVVCGIDCFESILSDEAERTGIVEMPTEYEEYTGGHAILLTKYDDLKQQFTFRNSWGKWGKSGNGCLPYDYIRKYAADFWVILSGEGF
jgi:C1A family cysteine protease